VINLILSAQARSLAVVLMYVSCLGVTAFAAAEATFEVASIRPSPPGVRMTVGIELRHGRLRGINVPLRRIIANAYGVADPLILGPDWLNKYHFDILANSPDGVPDTEMKPMLQSLLKDRFQLTVHRETRKMSAYDLVVAKGGPKMAVYPAPAKAAPSNPGSPMLGGTMTMAQLAQVISRVVGKPVFDRTGLAERYNFFLSFARLSLETGDVSNGGRPDLGGAPDLFTAVQEQLGLKLEPEKEGVEVIIVDHIEQSPSEN
jgi:uncharacterized protein (TIGR03435 family)